jgi:AraC family transcriptional regulator, regulatory protein of adaptative response / methylated-DNA-[protein]-cysteine methyltransferase
MTSQQQLNYDRIATAIQYIKANFKTQPDLDEVAEKVNLSPFHFQRLFTDWAGVSPKKFLQYTTVEYAKKLLKDEQTSLFDTAYQTGLSGTSRLHDLFVNIEAMTPAEYREGGQNLIISYSVAVSPFGQILLASTSKGICHIAFVETKAQGLDTLKRQFPNAQFVENENETHQNALLFFQNDWQTLRQIKLHLKGTDFQLKVWESLLKIPMGRLSTYGGIAGSIGNPNASRAVGTAIGSNPVAFIIPCHRVIQSSGELGGYMWGGTRKTAIIGWEGGRLHCQ